MPGRRENESPRFDSDAFSALTVIAGTGRPNDDTGSLWHCDFPFSGRHAILPLSLTRPSRRDASRGQPYGALGILNSARHPHVFGCVREIHICGIHGGLYGAGGWGTAVEGTGRG